MAANVDEITMNYEEDGVQKVEELEKLVITKGVWATLAFKFRTKVGDEWSAPKIRLARYQKRDGEYKPKAKFNISSKDQADLIVAAITELSKDA